MAKQRTKRGKHRPAGGGAGRSSGGGSLMKLRGGFRSIAGGGKKKPRTRWGVALDVALWIALIAAALFLFSRRYG
jgi:hypothetical protein